jgi:hypothetical protein
MAIPLRRAFECLLIGHSERSTAVFCLSVHITERSAQSLKGIVPRPTTDKPSDADLHVCGQRSLSGVVSFLIGVVLVWFYKQLASCGAASFQASRSPRVSSQTSI